MGTSVTTDILRELAGFRADHGCAISIYLDFDPSSTPTIPDVETKFNAVLSEAEKLAERQADARDCRVALQSDLRRIRTWWNDEFTRDGANGVALFASSNDGLFRAVPMVDAARDSVRIGHELHVEPLAGRLESRDGTLVVVVSRERGNVYRLRDERLYEVADESEEQPGQHDQGGWSQGRYQRHIENLVQQHLKAVGSEIDRRARGGRSLVIVGVAPEERRSDLEAALSQEARDALVGWVSAEAHAGPKELLPLVRPLLDEAQARDELGLVERFEEARGKGGRAAAGWEQTLEAASDARIELLLLEEGTAKPIYRCRDCGRASVEDGTCPLDGTALEQEPEGADAAIHLTLKHGGAVTRVGRGALGDAGGIGALLRF
jgi:peptide chain release factor subunit 1